MAAGGGDTEPNKENEKLKRSRAEDFFAEELGSRKKVKSSRKKDDVSDSDEAPSKRKKDRRERSSSQGGSGRSEKERAADKGSSRRNVREGRKDVGKEFKRRHKNSRRLSSERDRSQSRDAVSSNEEDCLPGGRYWGGDTETNKEKSDVFKTQKRNRDYEVGSRYYDKPKPEIPGSEDPKVTDNYLVGQRYYDEKPATATKNKTEMGKDTEKEPPQRNVKKDEDLFTSKTGGAYIPPAKLRMMQASITDKTSIAYQRIAWEALKKSIHGHINKVNTSNIGIIARLLMKENIVRGRGLLCRSILQAQAASPTFTNVYSCLVNVINSRFPNIGELLLKRVILQFKRGFKRNDKPLCIASCQFIAHLVNQQVAHEIIALEMLTLLLENPTDDSVEVAVAFLKECGQKLLEVSPRGSNAIFDMLRNILHEGNLDKRVQYMIEVVFQVRKDGFASFPSIAEGLDLVEEEDQYTHILTLDEATDAEDLLNVFKHDTTYEENEEKYRALKVEIIGESSGSEERESGESGSEEDDSDALSGDEEKPKSADGVTILDSTETNLIALRRTIYLTIQSSLDFEECCHKLLKMQIKPGQESELCNMLLDCCAELRSYEKFFGLLAQRFCQINRTYIAPFEDMFRGSYSTVHRLDTNKLRNVARFFAHLLYTDAISWQVLDTIALNEEDTTSSSRIFIKILFQELAEYMGLANLNQRLKDPAYQPAMEGLFPRDNPKNTRFAINFFTSIGLGGLTDELREHLKSQPKPSAVSQLIQQLSSSSSSSESSSSESSSSDSSDSEDSDNEGKKMSSNKVKSGRGKERLQDKRKNNRGNEENQRRDRGGNEENQRRDREGNEETHRRDREGNEESQRRSQEGNEVRKFKGEDRSVREMGRRHNEMEDKNRKNNKENSWRRSGKDERESDNRDKGFRERERQNRDRENIDRVARDRETDRRNRNGDRRENSLRHEQNDRELARSDNFHERRERDKDKREGKTSENEKRQKDRTEKEDKRYSIKVKEKQKLYSEKEKISERNKKDRNPSPKRRERISPVSRKQRDSDRRK